MKKILTILICLVALTLFSCEDSGEDVFKEIDASGISEDFDSKDDISDDFDSGQ